jgi:hypothetical protein
MKILNLDGTVNVSLLAREIRKAAKSVDDTLFFCFDEIKGSRRNQTLEAIKILHNLADELLRQEDEFFSLTKDSQTNTLSISEEL